MRLPKLAHGSLILALIALTIAGCAGDRGGLLSPSPKDDENLQMMPAGAPAGYYDTVDATSAASLRSTLHEVIDDHTRYPYTSTATDTWDILESADEDPNNSSNILDIYKNASYPKQGGGNTLYNREHSWPKSYGFPNDVSANYPYTDAHHLFLADDGYNSSRSNKPYRYCDAGCGENPTEFNDGVGGGTGVYPGNSNWTSGSFTTGTWETWIDRRGDVARALLYLDVRYEGGNHGTTGAAEPDLILTDDENLIASSNTGNNESIGYMGMLSVLLQWHVEDPVDAKEMARNDVVFGFQGNRNPFIDHPEWVDCVFGGVCGGGDTTPPAAPGQLVAAGGDGVVDLDWADNAEGDLAGYNVFRATSAGGPYGQVNGALVTASAYTDASVSNGITYYYVVTAVDTSSNESAASNEASATPNGGGSGGGTPWINEFHYDNAGTDAGEFVEIAGPAGTSLAGWSVVGYNGNGGGTYDTVSLSGTLPDQSNGFGASSFAFLGMQNGSPDGLALVDDTGAVVEFLSYEGTIVGVGGPADGLTSTDVGVAEDSGTPVGYSLQRTGAGSQVSDFTWSAPMADTPGQPNTGQSFTGGGGPDVTPPAAPSGLAATAFDGSVELDWADNVETDLDGYNVYRATTSGGPYSQLNGTLLSASDYTDGAVMNGTTYYYVVTALDTSANESGDSNEVAATPQDTTPPTAPAGLGAVAGDGVVDLDWADNGEPDLDGYNVYRATASGGPFTQLNGAPLSTSAYSDGGVSNGTTYYYVVTAVDTNANESADSIEASATPQTPPSGAVVWINEFHYDNVRKDKNEFVEIAGAAGTDLSGWQVVAYNGSNGVEYDAVSLGGTIPNQQNGFGTVDVSLALQNGGPDGIALVDGSGAVVEFLSYEGTFSASSGPAAGLTSVDVGVAEDSNTPVGDSLQRTGTGNSPEDFSWSGPATDSPGQVNTGQTFAGAARPEVVLRRDVP